MDSPQNKLQTSNFIDHADVSQNHTNVSPAPNASTSHSSFFEDHQALTKAQQILASFKDHSVDFTSMFQDTEENSRAILFYVDQTTQDRLRTRIPPFTKPHVPDAETLQSLLSPQHLVSLLVSELRIHASTNRTPLIEMKDQIHKTVEKWISVDLRALLEKISRATSRPVDNSKYNSISIKYASGIAGYDVNNDLMRFIKRPDKSGIDSTDILPIAERIFSRNAVDRYHIPSYSDICRRFSIAEEFRNKRSDDGQAHRHPEDAVQWCLSPEFLECFICPPLMPNKAINATKSPISLGTVTPKVSNGSTKVTTKIFPTKNVRNLRKLKGSLDEAKKKTHTPTKTHNKSKGKGRGRGRKRKAMHPGDSETESEKQSTSSFDVQDPNVSDKQGDELESVSSETHTLPPRDDCASPIALATNHLTTEADVLPSLSVLCLVLHSEFQHNLSQRNIAFQAILTDGSIVRHGLVLPRMNIQSTATLNDLSVRNPPSCALQDQITPHSRLSYCSPQPGDIVSESEAKFALGFQSLSEPINSFDSPLAMNSIFVTSLQQIENFHEYSSQILLQDPSQSGYLDQEYSLFGYGGEPECKPSGSSYLSPQHDQTSSHPYNRAILRAIDDRRMVSLWFPIPSNHRLYTTSSSVSQSRQQHTSVTREKYFVFMGMYVVKSYTYRSYKPSQYTSRRTSLAAEAMVFSSHDDHCCDLLRSLRFLLCNHFKFSLLPTSSTVNADVRYDHPGNDSIQDHNILSVYERQLIRPHKEDVVMYNPNDIVLGDPQVTTDKICITHFFKELDNKTRCLLHHSSIMTPICKAL